MLPFRTFSDGACYIQVFLEVSCELALSHNRTRSSEERVPDEVVLEMQRRFEKPEPLKHAWEANTVILPSPIGRFELESEEYDQFCKSTYRLLLERWTQAPRLPPSLEELSAMKEKGTQANLTSTTHTLDLKARKIVSKVLKQLPSKERSTAASHLTDAKHLLLDSFGRRSCDEENLEDILQSFEDRCMHIARRDPNGE